MCVPHRCVYPSQLSADGPALHWYDRVLLQPRREACELCHSVAPLQSMVTGVILHVVRTSACILAEAKDSDRLFSVISGWFGVSCTCTKLCQSVSVSVHGYACWCDNVCCRFERIEIPFVITPTLHGHLSSPCLSALLQLPNILLEVSQCCSGHLESAPWIVQAYACLCLWEKFIE